VWYFLTYDEESKCLVTRSWFQHRHKCKSLKTARLAGLYVMVSTYLYMYAANITPAGTYFNLKLAMLLSLVADAHEVWRYAVAFMFRYDMISCGQLHSIPDQNSRCVLYCIASTNLFFWQSTLWHVYCWFSHIFLYFKLCQLLLCRDTSENYPWMLATLYASFLITSF